MTHAIKLAVTALIRFAVLWAVDAVSLLATAVVLPGVTLQNTPEASFWVIAISAAFVLAIVNFLIRPVVMLIARPLGWVVLFVIGFLVNAVALWITAWLLPSFEVTILGGILGGIVLAFFNSILTGLLDIDEEGSFYQNLIERRAKARPFDSAGEPGKGLMMLEVDGLSYWHAKKALEDGLMPNLKAMMEEDGYQLSLTDCGLPSMTSACQAGIMFGDNHDIPAYRWYDKDQRKLYVSNKDATELNARYAHGQGLMRHGSSIMNMMAGDAEKSLFTMANMWSGSEEEKRRRADDVALLMLNPYFLTRSLVLFFWEAGREVWQGWRQKVNNVEPRLNRLEHFYPFVRAATCGAMRDISAAIAILDMMRGAPSIYMLYLGYDEVAHHSGPWTSDAFGDLKRLDKTIGHLRRVIKEKAPRPYDLIILSDHGQSFGATFKQRYGVSIKEFIEQLLPQGTTVAQSIGGDTGAMGLQGVAGELANIQQTGTGNAMTKAVAKQGEKLANMGAAAENNSSHALGSAAGNTAAAQAATGVEAEVAAAVATAVAAEAQVTAYGSGNAAQVYFDLFPRKITLSELEAAYPGMVDALVEHEGLGMVIGYEDDMTAVVLGKCGKRNLHTGVVTGNDPVAPYAPASGHGAASIEKRVWQLRRVMDFEHAGDLWLISTVYPDGTVAALEELIGNHGGVGGEQTDAFVFHPPDMAVPETKCSTEVFHILDAHRNAPVVARAGAAAPAIADWAPSTLWAGLKQGRAWLGNMLQCLLLVRSGYQNVVNDPYMTGPALAIALVTAVLSSTARYGALKPLYILGEFALWLATVLVVYIAGHLLRGKSTFTKLFRAMGFAQTVYLLSVLAYFRPIASAVNLVVFIAGILAVWMGAAIALKLRGWRAALLPVAAAVVLGVGEWLLNSLLAGGQYTLQQLGDDLGVRHRE